MHLVQIRKPDGQHDLHTVGVVHLVRTDSRRAEPSAPGRTGCGAGNTPHHTISTPRTLPVVSRSPPTASASPRLSPSALYSLADPLVPVSSVSEDFFVRNSATSPAVLRITLIDAHANDVALANALTVTATLAGAAAGTPVALSAAEPCAVLLDGPILQPGDAYHRCRRLSPLAT